MASGTLLAALGVTLLGNAGLVTGGLVGAAFLLRHWTGFGFGPLFVALNLPFYVLAWRKKGAAFTLKTFTAVGVLSLLTEMMPRWLHLDGVEPVYAAVAGGVLAGVGLLILFRHNASLGGVNILVLWLQERFGWPAGWVQLGLDACILLTAFFVVGPTRATISLLGAATLNVTLALNHRPGRYMAV
ncbi:YitT family protein [Oxalobacteraceae bacterium OM1]|nr:YitT family protein [Oxalobacteraceae bacterium OM1]